MIIKPPKPGLGFGFWDLVFWDLVFWDLVWLGLGVAKIVFNLRCHLLSLFDVFCFEKSLDVSAL